MIPAVRLTAEPTDIFVRSIAISPHGCRGSVQRPVDLPIRFGVRLMVRAIRKAYPAIIVSAGGTPPAHGSGLFIVPLVAARNEEAAGWPWHLGVAAERSDGERHNKSRWREWQPLYSRLNVLVRNGLEGRVESNPSEHPASNLAIFCSRPDGRAIEGRIWIRIIPDRDGGL